MRLDNIISDYLSNGGTRIIIPGFGGFIKRGGGEVVFVDMLTNDDGVLAAEVAKTMNVSANDAATLIYKYSRQLRMELADDKQTTIDGIGVITAADKGGYSLTTPYAVRNELRPEVRANDIVRSPSQPLYTGMPKAVSAAGRQSPASSDRIVPEKSKQPNTPETSRPARKDAVNHAQSGPDKTGEIKAGDTIRPVNAGQSEEKASYSASQHRYAYTETRDNAPSKTPATVKAAAGTDELSSTHTNYRSTPGVRKENERKKVDFVMILAIIAISIAIAAFVYGRIVEKGAENIDILF